MEIKDYDVFYKYYSFIKNENLRINISLNGQYVNYLNQLFEKDYPVTIKSCLERDIYIHLAAIAEACLCYLLSEKNIEVKKEKYFEWKTNYSYDDYDVCAVKVKKGVKEFGRDTTFNELIDLVKKNKLVRKELISKLDDLRAKRNKIHFTSLNNKINSVEEIEIINPNDIRKAKVTVLQLYEILKELE